jgi:hypothetical protein
MGAMANIDIDVQDLVATVATVQAEYDLNDPDATDGLDGRGILLSRLTALGWITPTEANAKLRAQAAGLL